jgi:hypothetical protein
MIWKEIGKGVFQSKVVNGFTDVIQLGSNLWAVSMNGRVIGSAKTLEEGQQMAATFCGCEK